jgi:hypothetical protein
MDANQRMGARGEMFAKNLFKENPDLDVFIKKRSNDGGLDIVLRNRETKTLHRVEVKTTGLQGDTINDGMSHTYSRRANHQHGGTQVQGDVVSDGKGPLFNPDGNGQWLKQSAGEYGGLVPAHGSGGALTPSELAALAVPNRAENIVVAISPSPTTPGRANEFCHMAEVDTYVSIPVGSMGP